MIQSYYTSILSMNPLPWANSVERDFGAAQFMSQEARPQKPSRSASESSDLSLWHETFCFNEIAKEGAQEQMEVLRQKVAEAEETGDWLSLSSYHEDLKILSTTIIKAEDAQQDTMHKISKLLDHMEKLMFKWDETKRMFDKALQKLSSKAEKEEEKKKIIPEPQQNLDVVFEAFRKENNLSDEQIWQLLEKKQKEAQGTQGDSQPSKSNQQEEHASDASEKSSAAD